MHGTELHANIVKLERSWRSCDCFWTRKHRLELAQQEVDTWAARLRREQEQFSAVTVPMHGTPQLWAGKFSRSVAARGCRQRLPSTFSHGLARSHRMRWGINCWRVATMAWNAKWTSSMRSRTPRHQCCLLPPGCSSVCSLSGCCSKNSQGSLHAAASSWRSETRVRGRGLARDAGPSGVLADPPATKVSALGRFVPRWGLLTREAIRKCIR